MKKITHQQMIDWINDENNYFDDINFMILYVKQQDLFETETAIKRSGIIASQDKIILKQYKLLNLYSKLIQVLQYMLASEKDYDVESCEKEFKNIQKEIKELENE